MIIRAKVLTVMGEFSDFLDAKESQWAAFCCFKAIFTSSFCFLAKSSASVKEFQLESKLDRNQIRSSICLKQLQQPHLSWPLAFQRVVVQVLLQGQHQHQSQNQSLLTCLHKNTKIFSQEPFLVLGKPHMGTFGGASC